MKDLKFKIGCNFEVNAAIQKTLFALGCKWRDGSQEVQYAWMPFILVDNGIISGMGYEDEPEFMLDENTLVDLSGEDYAV